MGPVALLVFKTSEPANNGLVGSTPTRLRQLFCSPYGIETFACGMRSCVTSIPDAP